jgi:hypothetical protein
MVWLADCGTLIACGNYKGNLREIIKELNWWSFNNFDDEDPLKFEIRDGRIKPDLFATEFPCAVPVRLVVPSEHGHWIPNENDLLTDEDMDNRIEENVPLEEISKKISPLLTDGTLEFVATGHYKTQFVYIERLTICSDGVVKSHRQTFHSSKAADWIEESTETYDPKISRCRS